ncbi:hypothetical protein [Amycolatopsis acidicola]|nr:hypothetical protein [Amycolatopsis acidicola]
MTFPGPPMFSAFIPIFGTRRAGMAKIVVVLVAGLLPVRAPEGKR